VLVGRGVHVGVAAGPWGLLVALSLIGGASAAATCVGKSAGKALLEDGRLYKSAIAVAKQATIKIMTIMSQIGTLPFDFCCFEVWVSAITDYSLLNKRLKRTLCIRTLVYHEMLDYGYK
jgi:hypothetical protein